ncbi:response regulator [Thioclava sp. FR2]|uniref:response regulator n=1 Tax=Thioclava sp. FR2 TaxID=3445780 RepID=UPI003EBA2643
MNVRVLRYAALGFLAVVVISANVILFRQIDLQLKRSYTAESDSTIWNISQVEVELLRFQNALNASQVAGNSKEALEAVRLSFDLLYSRAALISERRDRAHQILVESDDWNDFVAPDGFIETTVPLIDGADADLIAAIPELTLAVTNQIKALRNDIVASSVSSIRRTEDQREELQASLQLFSAVALGLLLVMATLIVVIGFQGRARERHRKELSQVVFNLRTTIDSSLEAAVILDHEGKIIGCNRAGAKMFSWEEGASQPRYFADVIVDIKRGSAGVLKIASACRSGNENGRITLNGRRPDGSQFPLELSLAQARSATGMPIAIAFIRDISELVEREKALKDARNAALLGEQAKSRFLAMISHEMRTPLNGLLSAVELLKSGAKLNSNQTWLLRIIENCGKTTLDQVNNVLDLTSLRKVDEKSLPDVDFKPVDLINVVVDQFLPEAGARGNKINTVFSGEANKMLTGKSALIKRILTNLLSNAVKFTENGTITVGLDCQPGRSDGTMSVRLSVADTGVGIADSDRDRIFNTFETLDTSYSRLQEGSGLGLGLAKLSAEAMGGRMTVSSRKDEGSTFALYLTMKLAEPLLPSETRPAHSETSAALSPLRLLVVEDNAVNRELLVEILRQKGHEVFEARNGQEGVSEALQHRPDVILMDISMPVMDGLEATRRIRSYTSLPRMPIIAVTANAESVSDTEIAEVGIDAVLSKPVDIKNLENTIRNYVALGAPKARIQPDTSKVEAEQMAAESQNKTSHLRLVPPSDKLNDVRSEDAVDEQIAETSVSPAELLLDEAVFADLSDSLGKPYMKKLAARYVSEADAALAEIQDRQMAGDLQTAAAIAHKNAGAAASLGLRAMHRVLVTYEQEAKAGDHEAAQKTKERIETVKAETFDLLREMGLTG